MVLVRDPEHVADDVEREPRRHVEHEIALAAVGDCVDDPRPLLDRSREIADLVGREAAIHDQPQLRVSRVVHVDHRPEELEHLRRPVGDVGAASADEQLWIAAHVHHVGVANDGPEAGAALDVGVVEGRLRVPRHRALAPQARTRPPGRRRIGPRTPPTRGRCRRARGQSSASAPCRDATAVPSRAARASSATIASSVRVIAARRLQPPAGDDPIGPRHAARRSRQPVGDRLELLEARRPRAVWARVAASRRGARTSRAARSARRADDRRVRRASGRAGPCRPHHAVHGSVRALRAGFGAAGLHHPVTGEVLDRPVHEWAAHRPHLPERRRRRRAPAPPRNRAAALQR